MITISILGCGWLGVPLALRLLQEGYKVKGSTTRTEKLPSLKDMGIIPYLLRLEPELNGQQKADFFNTDILIINIPPGLHKHGEEFHPRQISEILKEIEDRPGLKVIYTSSTSVYPRQGENLGEEAANPQAEGANGVLLKAEALLQAALGERLTILRCGGLMGYDRISGKWSKGAAVADTPVNYLHRDDAVEIILQLIGQAAWGKVYNAVSPEHPSRAAIYSKNAAERGWPAAKVVATNQHKTISPQKLQQELGYSFRYPNPLEFPYLAN